MFHIKIKEIVYLLEEWLSLPQNLDNIDEWLINAEEIIDTFELSDYEKLYTDIMLDSYEEQFKLMIGIQIIPVASKEYMDELLSRKQTEQRTEEWYRQMTTIISASELGNLFGSAYQRCKFVVSKTLPYQPRQQNLATFSSRMSPFDWGIRFEPVVKQIYEHMHIATIKELGRMIHQVDPRCTASPDGLIYECIDSLKTGHLIEIKCPVSREINGIIPKDYYHQMQMQLHVTGLHACEFVEASFSSMYNQDNPKEGPGLYYGTIVLVRRNIVVNGQEFYYIYGPVNTDEWVPMIDADDDIIELIPWRLFQWSEQTVQRSEEWWLSTYPLIEEFWRDVQRHKDGDFIIVESSRPKKKQKANETAKTKRVVNQKNTSIRESTL
jgi:hypothetical protein